MSKNDSSLILGLLGIAFIILKLCHVIDWSWWWILSPFWIGLALLFIFLAFFFGAPLLFGGAIIIGNALYRIFKK